MAEVVALPQQWLANIERERERQAVAEVRPGAMAAALAEVRVGLAGKARLALGHRLHDEICLLEEVVQASADDRVALRVEDDSAFQIAGRG